MHQNVLIQGKPKIASIKNIINWLFFDLIQSDETSTVNHQIGEYIDPNFWHPPHGAGDNESNSYFPGAHPHSSNDLSRRTSVSFVSF